ncbi:unnamed protein product [Linum tenue]|uniref:Uncharacterized protein n=1 Tax=Linum tenue TaxID=586396 RepID=A0AAV0HUU5_9ROSI|nr:unnamed protein product [Linum tenue]
MESKLLMSGSDYYSVCIFHVINQLVSITRVISKTVMWDLIHVCIWSLTTSLHAPSNESQLMSLKFAQAQTRVWCLTTSLYSSTLRRCVTPGPRITSSAFGALGGRVSFGPRGITSSAAGTLPGRVSLGPRLISTALICSASSGKGRFMSSAAGYVNMFLLVLYLVRTHPRRLWRYLDFAASTFFFLFLLCSSRISNLAFLCV